MDKREGVASLAYFARSESSAGTRFHQSVSRAKSHHHADFKQYRRYRVRMKWIKF